MPNARWISEADVVRLMHLGDAIKGLEHGLREEALGSARNMEKTTAHWGSSSNMHAIGGVFESAGVFGAKSWGHTPQGSNPLLVLWDAQDGKLLAAIEAMALGQMRTGAMSGVATRWMSHPDADDLAIIGSGKQALTQIAAVSAVRKLRRVRVYSPTVEKRRAFAEQLRSYFSETEIVTRDDVETAVDGASIITLVTRAREPVLHASMIARGSHVNAVGAITDERKEFAQDIFPRADMVAVDSLPTTQQLSAEFIEWYDGHQGGDWSGVQRISDIVARAKPRETTTDISLFKAMGMGISDLALGIEILRRAEKAGSGVPIPQRVPVTPRIFEFERETAA